MECPCGKKATHEGFCQKCWWANHGVTTGPGTVCSTEGCSKPISHNKLCSACITRVRRAAPDYIRKSTGTCTCGSPSYRKGMCDKCYSRERRSRGK
jgi:hypothetical protein